MRLSQVHGAAPFAGDHFRQIFFLLLLTALGEDRRHRALRQSIIHGEGHVRTDQIFAKSTRNNVWQALPAKFRWHGKRSEEHTSELQSLMRISYAVFCLKKQKQKKRKAHNRHNKYT